MQHNHRSLNRISALDLRVLERVVAQIDEQSGNPGLETPPALGHGRAAQIPLLDVETLEDVGHNDRIQPVEQSRVDPLPPGLDGSAVRLGFGFDNSR